MSKNNTKNSSDKKSTVDFDSVLKKIRDESENESEKGTRFENLMKDYFETDKLYKNRFVKVWKWMEWPDREGPDIGIDLVAQEKDGSLCAIQCKCYADDATLSEKQITNFIADVEAEKIKNKILAYTGATLTPHANRILTKTHCGIIQQEHLRSSSVDWSEFPKLRVKDPFSLKDFQEIARDDVLKGFEKHERGKMIMACGTGKTLVSLHLAEKIAGKGGLVLFLVPSISLILQSMRGWSDNANIKHYYVAVCSDKSAGEEGSLTELESPVSTDVDTLKQSIKNRPKDSMTVIFSTYHSIEVVEKATKGEIFDIVISDEAHRTTGIEDKSFYTRVHKNKNIDSKKRLYMTATPRIYSAAIKAKTGDALFSMNDEKTYGPEFHKLSFTDAVQKYHALSDFKVKIAIVPEDVAEKDFQLSVSGKEKSMPLDERTLLAAVWHGLQYPDDDKAPPRLLQRVIAFCNRIDRSQMFAGVITDKNDDSRSFEKVVQEFNKARPTPFKVEVGHVDGTNNALYRREKMRWLGRSNEDKNACRILSNARCLSEGVDVPALDGVVFVNPRKSVVDVVQSVGRVMRTSPDKEFGYIILPVAVPAGIPIHEALNDNKTFKVVWQVLNALRSHDEMFAKEINSLILDKKTENTGPITSRISVSILDDQDSESPPITEFLSKIKSKLVEKVGDINYYEKYGEKIGKASSTVKEIIEKTLKTSPALESDLSKFHNDLKKMINESVTREDAIVVISQHVILSKVFDELFSGEFTSHNPISIALDNMAGKFGLNVELEQLEEFYDTVKKEVAEIKTKEARQNFIKTIYGNFFTSTSKKETEQHGIVYTPVEVIDFIIQSVEKLLHENFNIGFNERSVKVLDPFTGTGTFITRILESGLITTNIYKKYKHDLYANELILLAYYIATVNIETTYSSLQKSGKYVPFEGINYTDSLRLNAQYRKDERHRQQDQSLDDTFKIAHERVRTQRSSHLHVIMGNPPYSKGQSTFSDNNPNVDYPEVDKRIKLTYMQKARTHDKKSLYDSYVRSLRWASDRIGNSGVIAFVTNASFIRTDTGSGIRACLEEEFNDIWCFDLRGNQRTQGELSRKEGGKIFGSGSRAPVAIIILIKNPSKKTHIIHYKDVGDYLTKDQKLKIIKESKSMKGIEDWKIIKPDKNHDWINQQNNSFTNYLPIGSKDAKAGKENAIFGVYSLGVATHRDIWAYNSSKNELSKNVKHHIEYCNSQNLNDPHLDNKPHDLKQVRWTGGLTKKLKKSKHTFEKNKIRISLYRPFFKQYLYFDDVFIDALYLIPKFFPDEKSENILICVPYKGTGERFSTLITNVIPDLHILAQNQCFPLYVYEFDKNGKRKRKDNITESTLKEYRVFYNDQKITKEDIFYYVYGILHHPKYCKKYSNNLSSQLPHIPMAPEFLKFCQSGRDLAKLHLNYEVCKKYDLGKPKNDTFGKLGKISFGKKIVNNKKENDQSKILINNILIFENIPKIKYCQNGRTPLEWLADRFQSGIDKDSGIVIRHDDVDIVSLIERIVYVSVESDKIIQVLPDEFEPKNWTLKKRGLEQFT